MTTRNKVFTITLLFIGVLTTHHVSAQDRYFARTYTSNVLPKNAIDLEIWHTSRIGHSNQFYNAQDQRIELEFGLGKNLQTSVYFNRYSTRFSDGANGTQLENELGFSNEWKWKLLDPSAQPVGLALYGEWGVKGGDELELESKIILDKWIGNHLLAFNGVWEYERTFDWQNNKPKNDEWAAPMEFDFGYQYLIRPSLGVGIEIVNHNDIEKEKGWENSVFFAGPTINFRNEKWFLILNCLPQWQNLKKTEVSPDAKVLDKLERMELRFIVGVSF